MINMVLNDREFNENDLLAFEEKTGYKLPKDYIDFLQQYNGGYVEDDTCTYHNNGEQKFILTCMFGLATDEAYDLLNLFEIYKCRIPISCIPIGRDAGGNIVCLNLSNNRYGYIYFWDHEKELEYEDGEMTIDDLYYIADSFKGFLNSIQADEIN
ncbi:SMI1/KNR4 family protein [Hazenella sp. IB182353]|uniref:SMI1/KNR4 family protein n=1 Tax=Polycladospora coralii TaxID=2771432 RepID=UPI00174688F9|nr:SMI1/KNR4 family protein [Polycladospora coralii]MBS7531598.1 SMI1/KNR4 family protein [Polycladospora coralii]